MAMIDKKSYRKWLRRFSKTSIRTKEATANMEHERKEASEEELSIASTSSSSSRSSATKPNATATAQQYRCQEATPPSSSGAVDYGYGSASPDATDYGYGDAVPDAPVDISPSSSRRTPRRSSMKQQGTPRRASIQHIGVVEIQLPQRTKKLKRRTSISFDEAVSIAQVAPISTLTDTPEQLWFQDKEYKRIRQKSLALVDRAEKDGTIVGKKYCMRGLEKLLTPETTAVKKNQAWDSVLNEQYLQRQETDGFNEEHMANLYKFSTIRCQVEATKRATQDAQEAEQYLRETRRQYRRRMSM